MFENRHTVKLWSNAYIKFGGGRAMRFSKGGGDAQAERFTGVIPSLLVTGIAVVVLVAAVFTFAR